LYDSLRSLFCDISGSLPRQWWYMPSLKICSICGMRHSDIAFSLSPYSNKALISGAHWWEIKYTYLQDIYCIVKLWIQRNKSISLIKMCMCGEWMVYGDDGDNNGGNNGGGSLILLLLFWGVTYVPCFLKLYDENEMLFFFFSFEVPSTCSFLFPRISLFFLEHSTLEII